MTLKTEMPVDPHPEVTAFAQLVIAKGQEFADAGKWCNTWKDCVREMGLDPDHVQKTIDVEVDMLVPIRVTMPVEQTEIAGMSRTQVNEYVAAKITPVMRPEGNRRFVGLWAQDPRTGLVQVDSHYHPHARFGEAKAPLVLDVNLATTPSGRGEWYHDEFILNGENTNPVWSPTVDPAHKHVMSGVRRENISNASETWVVLHGEHARDWQFAGEGDAASKPWCQPCLDYRGGYTRPATDLERAAAGADPGYTAPPRVDFDAAVESMKRSIKRIKPV